MTAWRYFLRVVVGEQEQLEQMVESGRVAVYRLPVGAPVSLLESLQRRGEYVWKPSDLMWRAHYLGSDYEFTEISPERAHELFTRWVAQGVLPAYPPEESPITPEIARHLSGLDEQAQAAWRDVPTPPGAEDVTG